MNQMTECTLCPRRCGADRTVGVGLCGGGSAARISKVMLHRWEEPCICGDAGTLAVFFSGCALGCVYCQNRDISRASAGEKYSVDELAGLFFRAEQEGAVSLDLVTPSHYAPQIDEALGRCDLRVPVVYNIG